MGVDGSEKKQKEKETTEKKEKIGKKGGISFHFWFVYLYLENQNLLLEGINFFNIINFKCF